MDTQPSSNEDDLSDVERRLTGWQPAAERLDADAMLFAAGRAAGQGGLGRLLWPACCVLLVVQAAGLLVWGLAERAERFPLTLLTTQTHDAKRSGDVRARIAMLASMPDEWATHVERWFEIT